MSLRFILGLGMGDLNKGFPEITGEFQENRTTLHKFKGSLPPAPEVAEMQRRWQAICRATQSSKFFSRIKVKSTGLKNFSEDNPKFVYQGLTESMRLWLSSEEFYTGIEKNFRKEIDAVGGRHECFEVFIESKDSEIWNLPWDAWKFREDYKNCEIIQSPSQYRQPLKQATTGGMPLPSQGRILCVLGNGEGLDLKQDRKSIEKSLGDRCELQFMQQPAPDKLRDLLLKDEKNWQILYYGGHSNSNAINGWLHINQADCDNTVTVDYLKESLNVSIFKGLELLILNSCSSLKLAEDLVAGGLPLPSTIVMRAPIPDKIANDFVKSLFRYLGEEYPLFLAVRKAKDDLQRWESEFPGASAIPVLCQQPTFEGLKLLELKCDRPFAIPTDDVTPVKPSYPVANRPNHPQFTIQTKFMQRTSISLAGLAIGYPLIGPHLASAINTFGIQNHRNHQFLIAKASYNLAASINPANGESSYNLSELCKQLNDRKCEREAMQNAVWRGLPEAHAQISKSFLLENKPEEVLKAIALCLQTAKQDGVKSACFKNRGWLRLKQNRYDAAETDLRKAISLSNQTPEAQCLLAQVLEAKGKPKEALTHWQQTLKSANSSIPEQDECIQMAKERLPIIGKSQ